MLRVWLCVVSSESSKRSVGIGLEFFHNVGLANSHEIRSLGKYSMAGSILMIPILPSKLLGKKRKKDPLEHRNFATAVK
jgi:hypothetical protein